MARALLIWAALAIAVAVPVGVAATSPLLAFREPLYIAAGLAGALALAPLPLQPLLALGSPPGLGGLRRRLRLAPAVWRPCHMALASVVVLGGVVHAMLIEGTMGPLSKAALCALTLAAWGKAMADRRPWRALARRRP